MVCQTCEQTLFIGKGEVNLPRNYGAGPIERLWEANLHIKQLNLPEGKFGLSNQEWYEFWKLGDANLDGSIDQNDLNFISGYIGGWHPSADINEDHAVDETDLQLAAGNYGLNIWDYYGYIKPTDIQNFVIGILAGLGVIGVVAWAGHKIEKRKKTK